MEKTIRKSNMELLRIFAILIIISSHLSCHGVQNILGKDAYSVWNKGSLLNQLFSSLLLPGGQVGVAIFFMITGYFQNSNTRKSIKKCATTCIFYGCIIGGITIVLPLIGFSVHIDDTFTRLIYIIKNICNPLSSGEWWFISAYTLLIILSPMINKYMDDLTQKQFTHILCVCWFLWYSVAYFVNASYLGLEKGIFFYLIGMYIKKYPVKSGKKSSHFKNILMFCVFWIMGSICYFIYAKGMTGYFNAIHGYGFIMKFLDMLIFSIVVPVCAYHSFCFFVNLNISYSKFINHFGSTTLGIYLLHDSYIGRELIWHDLFKTDTILYQNVWFPVWTLVCVMAVFLVGASFDLARQALMNHVFMKTKKCIIISGRRDEEKGRN